jgi:hypothetical protein
MTGHRVNVSKSFEFYAQPWSSPQASDLASLVVTVFEVSERFWEV